MNNINKKINILEIIIVLTFLIIFLFLIKIIIIDRKIYINKLYEINNTFVYGDSAPRGRIYDRNNKLLVDNKGIRTLYYSKSKNITTNEEINLAYKVIDYIDIDYSKVTDRMLKEFYILIDKDINSKITNEEWDKLDKRILNSNDIYNLKISRITKEEIDNLSILDKKASYIYYLMNNGYSYMDKVIKKDINDIEYAYFSENNIPGFNIKITWDRVYMYDDTFKTILGSVGPIPKELKNYYLDKGYSLNDIVGLSYIEYQYEDILRGKKAKYRKINNNELELIEEEEKGNDIVLNIDIELIKEINNIIDNELIKTKKELNTEYLSKTYVIITDPNTGGIIAMTGRNLYKDNDTYKTYDITPYIITDPMTPGSVVKGASMLVGYNTGSINIGDKTTDECIKLYNIPKKCSNTMYGKVNDITALAYSSNVYQFKIAMKVAGLDYKYNMKVNSFNENAFDIYRKTFKEFGLGVKTEIDLNGESLGYSGNKKTIDLLLNYAIGQYDSYTPIQLSQYITTIASNGNRLKPRLLKEVRYKDKTEKIEPMILNKVETEEKYLKRVQEGFKAVMDFGYGKSVMGKNRDSAGKTGTSETFIDTNNDGIIDTETISNAFVGYSPSNNPTMTITVVSPDISRPSNIYHIPYMNKRIAKLVTNKYFELY